MHPHCKRHIPFMLCTPSIFRSLLRGLHIATIMILGVLCFCNSGCHVGLIYAPARYEPSTWEHLPPSLELLRYHVDQKTQISFYSRPASGGEPLRIWLMFNGQGDVALQWPDLLSHAKDKDAGFLLLDYPGFGFCEGSSTPGRILAASEGAAEALRQMLGYSKETFAERLCVFGHSLGTATALQYAAKHQVRRIILAAPFTTLADMGNLMYFWPCGQLIRDRFDNIARLSEIACQAHRPQVMIMHGGNDDTIPVEMSARLAAPYPNWVERTVVPGADHDTVVEAALRKIAVQ